MESAASEAAPPLKVSRVESAVGDDDAGVAAMLRHERDYYGYPAKVSEKEVGVTQYVKEGAGFELLVKQTWRDFIVREIQADGQPVYLTDCDTIPQDPPPPPIVYVDANDGTGTTYESGQAFLEALFGAEKVQQLQRVLLDNDKSSSVALQTGAVKRWKRKLVHQAIRETFEGKFESSTTPDTIEVRLKKRNAKRWENSWPKERPSYLQFVLWKENFDTTSAIALLSKRCRTKTKIFAWSGTKDKRAITTQLVTAFKLRAEKLRAAVQDVSGLKVGNFEYVENPLRLGSHGGNRFHLGLRFVHGASDEQVLERVESVKRNGFINYFGLQRFGNGTSPSHVVGIAVLKGDWQNAVIHILRNDCPSLFVDGDYRKALRAVRKRSPAHSMLQQLVKDPRGYRNAFSALPRNLRSLYPHAYQSFIWNRAVSLRVQLFGCDKVVVGDLVVPAAEEVTAQTQPHEVTQDNLQQWSVADVVLPLPGLDAKYPKHRVGAEMQEWLKADGLASMARKDTKTFNVHGTYRRIVVKPVDVQAKIKRYNTISDRVTVLDPGLRDLDEMEQQLAATGIPGGHYRALDFAFTLPTGAYATMCVRELQHRVSDKEYHKSMIAKWNTEILRRHEEKKRIAAQEEEEKHGTAQQQQQQQQQEGAAQQQGTKRKLDEAKSADKPE